MTHRAVVTNSNNFASYSVSVHAAVSEQPPAYHNGSVTYTSRCGRKYLLPVHATRTFEDSLYCERCARCEQLLGMP